MTTQLIPRPMALLKLLALGPMHKAHIYDVTRWPMEEVEQILAEHAKAGRVTHWNGNQLQHYQLTSCGASACQ